MHGIDILVLESLGRGKDNAKKSAWFKRNLNIDRRDLCQSIENLRMSGIPVGASRNRDGGYYLIDSLEDKQLTVGQMKSQAIKMLKVARAIEQANLDGEQMELVE